ncbi:hypothetical protein NP233_g12981 [Leucocoprinus birnbaumii]|uniref:Uncharacterized protein n=1 Tax=Leucocoprinus birnbaumii TaxID=56174 RepID=A0AAD5VHN6_9AGAR|nr:hypothetical protein NP233_g12981 [Leucocoprinus birnbaumii]
MIGGVIHAEIGETLTVETVDPLTAGATMTDFEDGMTRVSADLGLLHLVGQDHHLATGVHAHRHLVGTLQAAGQGHEHAHRPADEAIHLRIHVQELLLEVEPHLLGHHRLNDSNSVTTLYQTAHGHPEPALGPVPPPPSAKEKNIPPASPILTSRPLSPKRPEIAPPRQPTPAPSTEAIAVGVEEKPIIKMEESISTIPSPKDHPMQPIPNHPIQPEPRDTPVRVEIKKEERMPPTQPRADLAARQSSSTPKPDMKAEPRGRSHSPPKGPRAFQWRKTSKSPPKGPRNVGAPALAMATTPALPPGPSPAPAPIPPPAPTTTSAPIPNLIAAPVYPTGPRADRRPKDQNTNQIRLQSLEKSLIPPPTTELWQGRDPPMPDTSLVRLEAEVRLKRAARLNVSKEMDRLNSQCLRALHDVEMASIDLRAAEGRRKIADAQLEKARQGALGIDYNPPEATPE